MSVNKYAPEHQKKLYHFRCDLCGEEYVAEMSEAELDAEAERNWGLLKQHANPEARTICAECHGKIIAPITG